ncbi:hypothetical protein XENTR_v10021651 [Xenopus tropicalis]|nr:hypothetical protein XENTR_v10021651 [Xenopus tropicalis]
MLVSRSAASRSLWLPLSLLSWETSGSWSDSEYIIFYSFILAGEIQNICKIKPDSIADEVHVYRTTRHKGMEHVQYLAVHGFNLLDRARSNFGSKEPFSFSTTKDMV